MQGIEKLEIGKAYSYKELCAILGEKETNNREKQYTRWNRYFTFERKRKKYYILSIRETPIPDGRSKGNNRKYLDSQIAKYDIFRLPHYDTSTLLLRHLF